MANRGYDVVVDVDQEVRIQVDASTQVTKADTVPPG
jgi:hypothetical protein